ncbi:MAG: isoprenylcysteine carboxylmethyltransferase family protein [Acidobacteriota bacterium]|jgi:protein-S-isoprenylcysteine O-methyltransferase Ste14
MPLISDYFFPAVWLTFMAYWWVMSKNVKVNDRRESLLSRLVRLVLIVCAVALLWLPSVPPPLLDKRFLPHGDSCFWSGLAVTAGGLLFATWARRHLGSNWSQAVTVKEGHELITSGPYALVRHPIYAGLLVAFVGSAVARGEWRGLLAVVLVFGVLWRKLKLEEKWMRVQFGESYDVYSRRVAALLPYVV